LGPAQRRVFPEILEGEGVNGLHCAACTYTHSPPNRPPPLAYTSDFLRKLREVASSPPPRPGTQLSGSPSLVADNPRDGSRTKFFNS
jgi:hypothetical protein